MARTDKITAHIEMLCNEWAIWVIMNEELSPLGFKSETVEAAIKNGTAEKSGRVCGSNVPAFVFRGRDPRLTVISHALFALPSPWGHAIWCRHLAPSKLKAPGGDDTKEIELKTDAQRCGYYRSQWACGSGVYYSNLKAGYAYIMGLLNTKIPRAA